MNNTFKKKHSLSKRQEESNRILQKYKDKVPIIVQQDATSTLPILDKIKYLVPRDLSLGQFLFVIRKRIKLKPEKSLILFVNNKIIANHLLLSEIYEQSTNFIDDS